MGEVKQEITNEVNTDAGCFGDDRIGLGGVMHDSMGEVMPATYTTMRGSGSVDVVEALAARHYLKIALDA